MADKKFRFLGGLATWTATTSSSALYTSATNAAGPLSAANATGRNGTGDAGNATLAGQPRAGHCEPRTFGGMTGGSGVHWMNSLTESGCGPGVNLIEMGGPMASSNSVGSGGGYGGFYCFALPN